MDIFSHALAGAATGFAFNNPILGAVIAVTPDIPIFGPRKENPPLLYKFTHSILFLIIGVIVGSFYNVGALVFYCLFSHLLLDIPTHGPVWAPRLLWPYGGIMVAAKEWEFFNRTWYYGLALTVTWSTLWILIQRQL